METGLVTFDLRPCPRLLVGPLFLEAGSVRHRIGHIWLPDGLHCWWGDRGVHLFWHSAPRIVRDWDCG